MRKLLLAVGCCFVVFFESCSGCKESGPSVNLNPSRGEHTDKVMMLSSAELAALLPIHHHVLAEEFSGQMCPNCPSAAEQLAAISSLHPGLIHIVTLYTYGGPQSKPTPESVYNFQDSIATDIGNTFYGGVGNLPSGGIDRLQDSAKENKIVSDRTFWPNNINTQLLVTDSINLSLQSSYDPGTQTAKVIATITYIQPVSAKQNLTIVLVESDIEDAQEFPDGIHHNYIFNHVFRDMISTPIAGDPILDSLDSKPRGTVLERTYYYKLARKTPAIKPQHCDVVAFINSTGSGKLRVLQSAETKFKP